MRVKITFQYFFSFLATMMTIFYLLGAVFTLFYIFVKRKHSYWKRMGVPHIEPEFIFGNSRGIDKTIHHSEIWRNHYFKLKDKGPIVGFYLYTEPIAMITDPELMKRMYITDFDYFCNRGFYLNEKYDPATANILSIENERWQSFRERVEPLFVNERLKNYFVKISETVDLFHERLEVEGYPELREIVSRFIIDTLGRVFFTTEFNQLKEKRYDMVTRINGPVRGITYTSKTFAEIYRWLLADILHLKVMPKETMTFMENFFREIIEKRNKSEKNTNDALDHLYSLHQSNNPITFDEVWANSTAFLMAGHDNSSSAVRHTLYELSKREDLQRKCRESIKEVMKKHNLKSAEEMTYEALMDMNFVEQCVYETLRLYTAPIFTGRMTKYDYKVPNTNITLEKGTLVHSAICGIHYDPKYFPDPEVWDPDRLEASKIKELPECALLPFGIGAHQCLGIRVALLMAKVAVAKTVLKYEMKLNREKTPEKLMFNPKIFRVTSEGVQGIYLNFKKIKE